VLCRFGSAPGSYFGVTCPNLVMETDYPHWDFRGFSQSLWAHAGIVYSVKQQPFPFISSPAWDSSVVVIRATCSQLPAPSLNKPQIKMTKVPLPAGSTDFSVSCRSGLVLRLLILSCEYRGYLRGEGGVKLRCLTVTSTYCQCRECLQPCLWPPLRLNGMVLNTNQNFSFAFTIWDLYRQRASLLLDLKFLYF
jgi:hypothetical protein